MPRTWLGNVMLIQCDYGCGDYLVRKQTVYYQGVKVSPVNPVPIWSVGEYELYIMPAVFPMKGAWLVIVQSRYPSFYECKKVELGFDKVILHLAGGRSLIVKPFKDGVHDRLLVETLHVV
ncbi:MAG: hypothetical protein IJ660_06035 [Alphaproteobacteria bacterium]|nr:hypothetical protein [Alphaproteobacteria bacterium]